MRVIAGQARSLPLKTPQGPDTRPTTDRIKETLFNMLQTRFPCGLFIDLCSGSGAIGIEALSRGARRAYFVENGREAASCIVENLRFTKFTERAVVLKQDVLNAVRFIREKHADIVFMDPPYQAGLEEPVLAALSHAPYVGPDTLIIIESEKDRNFSFAQEYGFAVTREKVYKTNKHVFFMRKDSHEESDLSGEL